jgi:hypothetical protein
MTVPGLAVIKVHSGVEDDGVRGVDDLRIGEGLAAGISLEVLWS